MLCTYQTSFGHWTEGCLKTLRIRWLDSSAERSGNRIVEWWGFVTLLCPTKGQGTRMVDHVAGSDDKLQRWTDVAFSTEQNKGCILDGRDAQLRRLRLASLLGWVFHLMGQPCQHRDWIHWNSQPGKLKWKWLTWVWCALAVIQEWNNFSISAWVI